MKKLLNIIFWILVGESIVLGLQPKVQKKIKQAQGWRKGSILAQELFDFNKKILKNLDSSHERESWMKQKLKHLEKDLLSLKKRVSKDGESIIEEIIKKRESTR